MVVDKPVAAPKVGIQYEDGGRRSEWRIAETHVFVMKLCHSAVFWCGRAAVFGACHRGQCSRQSGVVADTWLTGLTDRLVCWLEEPVPRFEMSLVLSLIIGNVCRNWPSLEGSTVDVVIGMVSPQGGISGCILLSFRPFGWAEVC